MKTEGLRSFRHLCNQVKKFSPPCSPSLFVSPPTNDLLTNNQIIKHEIQSLHMYTNCSCWVYQQLVSCYVLHWDVVIKLWVILLVKQDHVGGWFLQLNFKRSGDEMLTSKQEKVGVQLFLIVLKTNFHFSIFITTWSNLQRNLVELKYRQSSCFEHSRNKDKEEYVYFLWCNGTKEFTNSWQYVCINGMFTITVIIFNHYILCVCMYITCISPFMVITWS